MGIAIAILWASGIAAATFGVFALAADFIGPLDDESKATPDYQIQFWMLMGLEVSWVVLVSSIIWCAPENTVLGTLLGGLVGWCVLKVAYGSYRGYRPKRPTVHPSERHYYSPQGF
ncbi:hypothetical protein EYC59_00965 [Candidatus Saccharibacteria bacterium]|nr:MAG: hypothetical protein EYC59_00965 [Candidatus Saccharibacteria bacterium]